MFGINDMPTMAGMYGPPNSIQNKLPKARYGCFYSSHGFGTTYGSDSKDKLVEYNNEFHDCDDDYNIYCRSSNKPTTKNRRQKKSKKVGTATKYLSIPFPFLCTSRYTSRSESPPTDKEHENNLNTKNGCTGENGMSKKLIVKIARILTMKDLRLSKSFSSKKYGSVKGKRKKRWLQRNPVSSVYQSSTLNCSPISSTFEPMPTIVEETESELLALTIHRFATMLLPNHCRSTTSSPIPSSSSSFEDQDEKASPQRYPDDFRKRNGSQESIESDSSSGKMRKPPDQIENKGTLKYLRDLFSPQTNENIT